jgi:hypothetical protein
VLVLLRTGDASQLARNAVLAASPESNHGSVAVMGLRRTMSAQCRLLARDHV